jgi:chorismate mutase/prephenate dehydrogenase
LHRSESRTGRGELGGGSDSRPHASGGFHLTKKELESLREEIERIDSRIIELVSQREQVAAEIGLVKEKDGLDIRDRARERQIKSCFSKKAKSEGSDPVFSEILAELLISRSVKVQLTKKPKDLDGKLALVVGGSGKMGAWFCRRLSNRGARVQVWDPRGRLEGYDNLKLLGPAVKRADIVVVSSPLGACPEELAQVLVAGPKGLVFDVCSVKSHIAFQLRKATKAGLKVTSAHPMFGPNVASPKGRNIIICDCGSSKANAEAKKLFSGAGARVIETTLERHDKLMAYVLGMSHATTLLFAEALSNSGLDMEGLVAVNGPSFDRMIIAAKELSRESVRVYHDIQALNPNTRKMFVNLDGALSKIKRASEKENPGEFRRIFESNKRYLEVR